MAGKKETIRLKVPVGKLSELIRETAQEQVSPELHETYAKSDVELRIEENTVVIYLTPTAR